jgi:cytochrome c
MTGRRGGISALSTAAVLGAAALAVPGVARAADPVGDADRGEEIWQECAGCHQIGQGATDWVGPHLNGLFGRRAASHEGYAYSDSLARMGADGLTWTFETLDAYIENPLSLVSGTRMAYPGLADAQDRADLLAYLRTFSASPQNIPEAPRTANPSDPDLDPEILAIEGDPAYGEYLSSECTTCHQADGSNEGIPSITQWPEEAFVVAMHAYKRELRPHPVMQMMAKRLSNEEIAALAAYFATLEP